MAQLWVLCLDLWGSRHLGGQLSCAIRGSSSSSCVQPMFPVSVLVQEERLRPVQASCVIFCLIYLMKVKPCRQLGFLVLVSPPSWWAGICVPPSRYSLGWGGFLISLISLWSVMFCRNISPRSATMSTGRCSRQVQEVEVPHRVCSQADRLLVPPCGWAGGSCRLG